MRGSLGVFRNHCFKDLERGRGARFSALGGTASCEHREEHEESERWELRGTELCAE